MSSFSWSSAILLCQSPMSLKAQKGLHVLVVTLVVGTKDVVNEVDVVSSCNRSSNSRNIGLSVKSHIFALMHLSVGNELYISYHAVISIICVFVSKAINDVDIVFPKYSSS